MAVKFTGSITRHPAQILFGWYLLLIAVGGVSLWLPFSRNPEAAPISLVDAIFTATSACCVTGLSVRSTGNDFSLLGQIVIALLIQVGGIGIVTITTFVTLSLTGSQTLRQRATMAETLGAHVADDPRSVLTRVFAVTMLFELSASVLLFGQFLADGFPILSALWLAVFHSISAFCNAGFGLWDDNLVRYQGNLLVNVVIMTLIVVGGIGFPTLGDLWRKRMYLGESYWQRLHLHTKLMLVGTGALIVIGAALIYCLEVRNPKTLGSLPFSTAVLASFFQSITPRTAGFNTIDIGSLTNATLFVIMLWMLVGGGPCSTAGGFKVSTFSVLALLAWCKIAGRSRASVWKRTIPEEVIDKAITTVLLFLLFVTAGSLAIQIGEQMLVNDGIDERNRQFFLDSIFETVSALCTVGLSTGITPKLSDFSKICLSFLMFAGRLGPISIVLVLSAVKREGELKYSQEDVLIG